MSRTGRTLAAAVLAAVALTLVPGTAAADGACVYVGQGRIDTDSGSIYHPWPMWRC